MIHSSLSNEFPNYPTVNIDQKGDVVGLKSKVTFLRNQIAYSVKIADKYQSTQVSACLSTFETRAYLTIAFFKVDQIKPCKNQDVEVTEIDTQKLNQLMKDPSLLGIQKQPKSLYEPDNRKIMNTETVGTGKPWTPPMAHYVGTKELKARPMTRGNYNNYRDWAMPENENPDDEGYLVEYMDGGKPNDERHKGYISWSPKDVFEKAYSVNGRLTFGAAIEALKQGKRVQRSGWNGKGLFIFMQVPSEVPMEVVPKMSSLPQSVKDEFERRFTSGEKREGVDPIENNTIKYKNQLAMVYPDNTIYGWVASPSDVLEEDWVILD